VPRSVALVAIALLAAITAARATTVIPPTFDQLVARAQSVFVAEVIDVRAVWRDTRERRVIKTLVTFRVEDVWKGSASPTTQLEFLGGTIDDVTLQVHGVPQFRPGQRELLFVVDGGRPMVSPLVGFMHGRMRVERDPATGVDRVRTFDGRSFTSVAEIGAQRPPGVTVQTPMRLADFRSAVVARAGRAQ
jgi:hypothetical protein